MCEALVDLTGGGELCAEVVGLVCLPVGVCGTVAVDVGIYEADV